MKVIGHRGAAGLAPENTFAGFDLALEVGVDGLETDVQKTKDGKLVLFHDEFVDRTTNGTGRLQEKTWQELQELDAGSWFDDLYAGERIPLLLEALERYRIKTTFDLEIKQTGIECEVLDMVEQLHLLEYVTFTSNDLPTLRNIKENNSCARVGYITADLSEETLKRVVKAEIRYFCPWAEGVTKHLVNQWHPLGLFIRAWGVNKPEIMKNAICAGVDGMTINTPNLLLKELGRMQLNKVLGRYHESSPSNLL